MRTRAAAVLILGCAALAGGCGAKGPQAPTPEANRVASALSEIAAACGEAYQEGGPRGAHGAPGATVRSAALEHTRELADVYRRFPRRIYQDQTLENVVRRTIAYLRECGLGEAAAALQRQTSVRP